MTLPWPPNEISPNARGHWSKSYKVKAAYCAECHYLNLAAMSAIKGATHFKFTFAPPDNRRRDVDNVIASLKCIVDLLSRNSGVDDSKFEIEWPRKFSAPVKGGAVIIEVVGAISKARVAA